MSEQCVCGAMLDWEGDWTGSYQHEEAPEHWDAVLPTLTPADFEEWIEEIEHGLGWANSESAGTGNDVSTIGIARALIRRVLP